MSLITRTVAAAFLLVAMLQGALAERLAAPQGETLLVMRGDIDSANPERAAHFDRAMLEAMPSVTITTNTVWSKGEVTFTGVPLRHLAALVGARGTTLHAVALNGFTIDIPLDDPRQDGAIVAYRADGEPLSVRSLGPLRLVYPYDSSPRYRSELVYFRSVWQLTALEVEAR